MKDITSYNQKIEATHSLPHVFVILDDFSAIPLNRDDRQAMAELLISGRAAGIHVFFVTSLTGTKLIKQDIFANVPCRVAFSVSTRADSRAILGSNGAEELSSPGEAILKLFNVFEKCRVFHAESDYICKLLICN